MKRQAELIVVRAVEGDPELDDPHLVTPRGNGHAGQRLRPELTRTLPVKVPRPQPAAEAETGIRTPEKGGRDRTRAVVGSSCSQPRNPTCHHLGEPGFAKSWSDFRPDCRLSDPPPINSGY